MHFYLSGAFLMFQKYLSVLCVLPLSAGAAAPHASLLTGNDRWGCEVLLCLSNPAGPEAESECRGPVERLYTSLKSRHPFFPKCPLAGEGNRAEQVSDPFDPCGLSGLAEAPEGFIAEGVKAGRFYQVTKAARLNTAGKLKGSDESGFIRTKACVRGNEGTEPADDEKPAVHFYRTVVWQSEKSARAIDIWNGGVLVRRLRY